MMKSGECKVVEEPTSENDPRRVFHFKSFEVEPFGYEDLKKNNPRMPLQLAVKFRNAVLGDQCENIDVTNDRYQSDFVLQSHFSTQSYGLVQGGWFPPGFSTLDNMTYLLDRCAYNDVRAYCQGQDLEVPSRDFLEYLTHSGTSINILPVILEGNRQRVPSDFETVQQYNEVMSNLAPIMPKAIFRPKGAHAIIAAMRLLRDPFLADEREKRFLSDIATHLISPVGKNRREEVIRSIKLSADLHGIERFSFVLLAAISAVVCPQGGNPARNILKVRPNYSDQDIYNALSDLRSLKLLSGLIAILPDQNPVFCTSDKNLALFWVGLRGRDFLHSNGKMSFTISISDTLFPGLDAEFLQ
ncbi:hypothetical protein LCM17_05995 [Cereibacter sphaeroides]|nr:hypothetical protein [Cereibacter sphaeroides]